MEDEDGGSKFNTSEVDWGEESDNSWGEGEEQDNTSWYGDDYSASDAGDDPGGGELEPEPPDYDQGGELREVHEGDSWHEETDSQVSLEETEVYDDEFRNHEAELEDSFADESEVHYDVEQESCEEEPWHNEAEPEDSFGDEEEEPEPSYGEQELEEEEPEHINANNQSWEHSTDDEGDFESHHICFSGHSQGPEAYLRWEKDMEDWLQANNIPEEEKTSYAEDTLTEDAFRCWEQDAYVRLEYDEPDSSWEEMKQMLHKEFVEDAVTNLQYYSRIYANPEPRRWILATKSSPKPKQKRAYRDEPKKVLPSTLMEKTEANKPVRAKGVQPVPDHQTVKKKQGSKQLFKPQDKPKQCKSSKLSKDVITTCYRCHKRGHYAVVCPTRPVDKPKAQEQKLDSSSDCLVLSTHDFSIPSMMHLSLPKSFDPGIRQEEGNTSRDKIMFQIANAINVSLSFTRYIPMVLNSDIIHLFLAQSVENFAGNTKKKIGHEVGRRKSTEEQFQEAITPQACQATNLKSEAMPKPIPGTLVSETYDLIQYGNNIFTRYSFKYSVINDSNSSIKHLIFFLSVEKKTGARGVYTGWTAQDDKQVVIANNVLPQEEVNGGNKCEKGVFTKTAPLPPKGVKNKPWRGVISSSLIKEEPPDAHSSSHIYSQKYFGQGKFICPHLCKYTNLLYLGAGEIVSRSKPFQEGEYDEDIKSSSTKEHGTRSLEEENMKPRRAKETSELSSAQVEAKIKHPSSTNTWRSHSTHIEFTTKKNQPERIPDEEDIEDTFWKVFNGRYGDLHSLIESFRSNQEDLSYKSNCSRFSTHQRNTANWTRFNQRSYQGVISLTNRVNRNIPDLDLGALIGVFRPNQKEIGHEPTCYGILIQPGITSNWIRSNPGFGLGDIYFLSGGILNLPYLEAHGFRSLQTHIWRPGEYLLQPEASSIPSRHLEESSTSFSCTSIHRIRRIPSCSYFPYMTPRAFTLGAITLQRLFPLCCCVLETCSMHLDVPRHHSFAPKLSRLKPHHKFPYLAKIHSLSVQRLVCLVKTRFLSSS